MSAGCFVLRWGQDGCSVNVLVSCLGVVFWVSGVEDDGVG